MPKSFSNTLRGVIKGSGRSWYSICQDAGIGESVLSRFMHGGTITTKNLDRLLPALGVTLTKPNGRRR